MYTNLKSQFARVLSCQTRLLQFAELLPHRRTIIRRSCCMMFNESHVCALYCVCAFCVSCAWRMSVSRSFRSVTSNTKTTCNVAWKLPRTDRTHPCGRISVRELDREYAPSHRETNTFPSGRPRFEHPPQFQWRLFLLFGSERSRGATCHVVHVFMTRQESCGTAGRRVRLLVLGAKWCRFTPIAVERLGGCCSW